MSQVSSILPTPPDNFSTQIASASVSSSALSIELDDATGLPTEGVGQLFKKDSNGDIVAGSIEFCHWTGVSTNTITFTDTGDRGITGSDSGAQAYVADDYFEVWVSSYYMPNDELDNVFVASSGALDTTKVVDLTTAQTLTNKTLTAPVINSATGTWTSRVNPRETTETSSATPTINTDNTDIHTITALATNITSFTTNLSGTPVDGQKLIIRIQDSGSGQTIAWGASFESAGATLPTSITAGKKAYVGLMWNADDSVFDCVAAIEEA